MKIRISTVTLAVAALTLFSLPASRNIQAQAGLFRADPNLYSETASPAADISAAIVRAQREHKRIILDFGGNWCGGCQLLDLYYHRSPNAELLAKYFILIHVNIGHMDANVDIAKKYNVPITKGVPALALLDSHGKLLYSEHDKEFEYASMSDITEFLNRWKA